MDQCLSHDCMRINEIRCVKFGTQLTAFKNESNPLCKSFPYNLHSTEYNIPQRTRELIV